MDPSAARRRSCMRSRASPLPIVRFTRRRDGLVCKPLASLRIGPDAVVSLDRHGNFECREGLA